MLLSVFFCNAQDILVFKNGDEVKAKISEVNTSEVKYKKFDNMTGPTFSTAKSDLFMVKYENGTKDVFSSISNAAPKSNNQYEPPYKGSLHYLRAGGTLTGFAAAFVIIGATLVGVGEHQQISSGYVSGYGYYATSQTNSSMVISGAAFLCASVPFIITGPICIAKGKRLQKREQANPVSLSFSPAGSLSLNF